MIPISILDYSPIFEGSNAREALLHTEELAQLTDTLGFKRYWVAEHHHVFSVAGSTPEMLMMQLAAKTNRIRLGSGGVMLPHYSPYKVAEIFRMLEAFHPNRIDLGIGRSPGFPMVNRALNEERGHRVSFDQQVKDLYKYLTDDSQEDHRFSELIATPQVDTMPEIWLLGRGGRSSRVAADLGANYAFAHFVPSTKANGREITDDYRQRFKASSVQKRPYVMASVFVVIANTEEEAETLAQTFDLWVLAVESEDQPPYMPSVETVVERGFTQKEVERIQENRDRVVIGTPEQVKEGLNTLAQKVNADELLVIPQFYGENNRKKALELLADVWI
ncbi:LLM class flavin-dependent oxidoreductase [Alkalibacillus almallahensis]|uniref:LLM class flavin-dependent oxidoreductase n=1 Tax=Alkalibacillus almallahensis TaxID=1379154 RepID=UPI001420F27B|nr:LLM class flavin-dependent oxidoreductase [Alkalibacillus almallahensis]NIK13119.1 luciferase family oxidoreductase group 1 [Alkalibacillus almallahensis]